jgi:hypothetical protein
MLVKPYLLVFADMTVNTTDPTKANKPRRNKMRNIFLPGCLTDTKVMTEVRMNKEDNPSDNPFLYCNKFVYLFIPRAKKAVSPQQITKEKKRIKLPKDQNQTLCSKTFSWILFSFLHDREVQTFSCVLPSELSSFFFLVKLMP